MTLCAYDGGHCNCQPQEGVWCQSPRFKTNDYIDALHGTVTGQAAHIAKLEKMLTPRVVKLEPLNDWDRDTTRLGP
jgi:hypothetical protein